MEDDLSPVLLVSWTEVMIKRDSWGYSYLIVRGEILGFMKDERLLASGSGVTPYNCFSDRGIPLD